LDFRSIPFSSSSFTRTLTSSLSLSLPLSCPFHSELDPKEAAFYNNRAAALLMLRDFSRALEDSTTAVSFDASNSKVRNKRMKIERKED
jgi:hypothetical protein